MQNTETAAATDTAAEWTRYLDRQVRAAEKRVEVRVENAARYLAGKTVADLWEDDLDNYARALQDLRVARRELRTAVETRDAARDYFTARDA